MIYITRNSRVNGKVGRLGHKNGQFRHNRASNTELGMKILQNKILGTQISFSTNFGGKLSSILSFLFSERLHCCFLYNYCKYSRTCALKMMSFSISYWDLIQFPYFADTIERGDSGWKQAQREGEDSVTLEITLVSICHVQISVIWILVLGFNPDPSGLGLVWLRFKSVLLTLSKGANLIGWSQSVCVQYENERGWWWRFEFFNFQAVVCEIWKERGLGGA